MAGHSNGKIVELDDFSDESDESSFDFDDGDKVPLKFKESVLKNKRMFQKQLLDVAEIDPNTIFEVTPPQENEGDKKALMMALEQQTIPLPSEDIEGDKLVFLSKSMEPVPGFVDGIYKKVVVDGVGNCPPVDSIVTVHYNAYVEDESCGEIISFDSTVLRGKTRTFLRGQGRVIDGLDIAVGTMKSKEQAEFIISPRYAFGPFGCPPRVPSNAYVYFRVELIEWIDSCQAEAYCKLPRVLQKEAPFQQTLDAVQSQKSKAKAFLDKQNFCQAAQAYKQALHWIEDRGYANEEEEQRGIKESLALYLDLALAFLKLGRPIKARIYCREALNIDPKNAKAHYRLGQAEQKLGNHMEARSSFLAAKKILPNDTCINRALHEINTQIEGQEFIEKNLYRKMMGTLKLEKQNAAASVSDDFKVLLEKEFKFFMDDPSRTQMNFPYGMSASERAYLELESKRLNLKFSVRPTLKGEDIFVVQK